MSTGLRQTTESIPASESQAETPAVSRVRKYDKISYETRKELIKRVLKRGQKIAEVSAELNIKLSTSKFIIKSFKRFGRIFKKKSAEEPIQTRHSEPSVQSQTIVDQPSQGIANDSSRLTLVYYPLFVYQPFHWNQELGPTCLPSWPQAMQNGMLLPYP